MVGQADAIRDLIEPALSSTGLELWDVEVTRDTVRVLVDRPGGVDLDSLASVAGRVVSPILDDHPDLTPPGRFQLEVSSPGVERTLRRVDQYSRYVGTEVSVKTTVPMDGARRHHGTLSAVDESAIRLAPRDAPAGAELVIPHDRIEKARTVLVWGPAPRPGKAKAAKRPAADGRTAAARPVASNDPKDTGA